MSLYKGLFLFALLLAFMAANAQDGTVVVPRSLYEQLQSSGEERTKPEFGADPWVAHRSVTLKLVDDGLEFRVQWEIRTQKPGLFNELVPNPYFLVRELTWNGNKISMHGAKKRAPHEATGPARITGWVEDFATVEMVGWIDPKTLKTQQAHPLGVSLPLMRAVSGTVVLEGSERKLRLLMDGGDPSTPFERAFWTGAEMLRFHLDTPSPRVLKKPLSGEMRLGMGLTVLDDRVVGRARMHWMIHTGRTDSVHFSVRNLPQSVQLAGPMVKAWKRSGNTIVVTLKEPTRKRIALDLTWSEPHKVSEVREWPVPVFQPNGRFTSNTSLQIATSGELDVIPALQTAQPQALEKVPKYGRDLVVASPTATYGQVGSPLRGHLTLYRYAPADAPALVVDVAATTVAMTREGRTLARTRLTVRNERASHLTVCLPDEHVLLGVAVQQNPAVPQSADGCVRIPLPRSVESLKGAISFPVDLIYRGELDPWEVKESRDLSWIRVDAPTAVSRVSLHLPEEYRPLDGMKVGAVVQEFTEGNGVAYGFGLGGTDEARADQLWQGALEDWMGNRFGDAEKKLEELQVMGASNENIERLNSNIIMFGRDKPTVDDSKDSRRIKEQAKARAREDKFRQMDALEDAEKAMSEGNYDRAEQLYKEVEKITVTLQAVEQDEAVVEEVAIAAKARKGRGSARKMRAKAASPPPPPPPRPAPVSSSINDIGGLGSKGTGYGGGRQAESPAKYDQATHFDFEDVDIEGALVKPESDRLSVASTSMDLVIPKRGETVRFQHLLLESDQPAILNILAKGPRRK